MEQRVEVIWRLSRSGVFEAFFQMLAEYSETAHLIQFFDSTTARQHLGCRGKRGQQHQAFGRSRGGFSTKIHLKTDLEGHPLYFHLTGGEVSDSTEFETSLDIGRIRPRIAVTDKGYDSHSNRCGAGAWHHTGNPLVAWKSPAEGTIFAPRRLYKLRARIEQTIGKLKRFKRVAMRCDKTDISYSAIISSAGLTPVKSVHTA